VIHLPAIASPFRQGGTKRQTMKTTLSTYAVADLLLADNNANWSRAGALALADYLEEIERDTGEEMEFDRVAIRCDFSEFASLQDWIAEYYGQPFAEAMASAGIDLEGEEDEDELDELIRSHIQDHGQLVEFDGGVIVSSF
jgi:hypothetical protein